MLVSKKLYWTSHAERKMRQYGLSKSKVFTVIRKPERKEKGIAPKTTAVMQSNKPFLKTSVPTSPEASSWRSKKAPGEIWVMYVDAPSLRKIISAWRYPGVSKPGEAIPIPEDIRQELLHEQF